MTAERGNVHSSPSVPAQQPGHIQLQHKHAVPPVDISQEHADGPADQPAVSQTPVIPEPVGPRRSTRARAEPERLNIQSWGGQSYNAGVDQIGQQQYGNGQHSYPANSVMWQGPNFPYQYFHTAPYSVGHPPGLHPSVPGGGGGITGYGLPSNHMQSGYQTKYWPTANVNTTGLSLAQHSYPAQSGWY